MLALHICFRDLGIKWPLHDHYDVQVWTTGHELLATLPGRLIRHLVELHLGAAAIQGEMQQRMRPTKMFSRATVPDRERRDALRRQRRSRR